MGWSFNMINKIAKNPATFINKRILTLGTLYPYITDKEAKLLKLQGINLDVENRHFSKHFFEDFLNAECCHSLDVSDYQDSEIIVNLNNPLPSEFIESYDVVIDAGTLEHVSNMSIGLSNMLKLLKKGGIYLFGVPCNNWIDHGFFQFSPTFFKDLCIDNNSLSLLELYVADHKSEFDLTNSVNINPTFLKLLFASNNKLNVGGMIQKLDSVITLDLIQTKYRNVYENSDEKRFEIVSPQKIGLKNRFVNKFKELIFWMFSVPIIPLKYKEVFIKIFDKIKNK